jgi:hypothetical protein
MDESKWVVYDVARHSLLMRINDVSNALHLEEAKTTPDTAKIVALENELDALIDQSDMLSADDIELTSKIASGPRP